MSLEERLKSLQERLQKAPPPNERAVCTSLVEPLLRALGWDTDNHEEVFPEYSTRSGRVDYALRIQEGDRWTPVIFIEVKQPGKLDENAESQLFDYALREGVPAAFLTDGQHWRLYYPLTSGPPANRFVKAVNLLQDPLPRLVTFFEAFLHRKNVSSLRTYEKKMREGWEERIQLLALEEVWKGLQEPGSDLYELLAGRLSKKLKEPISPQQAETLWHKLRQAERVPQSEMPSPAAEPTSPARTPEWHLWYKGEKLSDRKLRRLIANLFCRIAQDNQTFLESFYKSNLNGGYKLKYLGRSLDDLFKNSEIEASEHMTMKLPCGEWYLMVNFSKSGARTIVKRVSKFLGLPFGNEQGLKVGW